jgi:LuxR family maltose regulon positive regulatory protein
MQVGESRPLLRAKLLVPTVPSTVVERSRLHDRLRTDPYVRLTTVIAPAGWGKTTMLAAWARSSEWQGRVGWLSLDEADDEPVRFWTYALSSLGSVAPDLTRQSLAALSAPSIDLLGVALPPLLNALTGSDGSYALVLDDFHTLRDPQICQSVEFLLTYLPPALRLVIAGRMDPPLPLARMRARGDLEEIRVADLRCTVAEGTALLTGVSNLAGVVEGAGVQLVQQTEGWPAGLHLAALALRGAEDADAMAASLAANERHLLDYFAAEVLPALSREQQDFLVRSSVLERLSGALCDAALGTSNAAELLDELDRAALFISSLGGGWYRCHRLFREVLTRKLHAGTTDGARDVLGRAADWFLAQGRLEEAIEHRLAAGDHAEALQLLVDHDQWFLDRGAFAAFLRLGETLAKSIDDARLFVALAVAAGESGREERCVHWLEEAEPLIDAATEPLPGWRTLRGQADMAWAMFGSPGDQEAALRHARRAVDLEDEPTLPGYIISRQVFASALWGAGRIDEAITLLRECWHSPTRRELPSLLVLQAAGQLGGILVEARDLDGARRITHEVQELAEAAEQTWGQGAAAAVAALRFVEARLTMEVDPAASVPQFARAVDLAEGWGWATAIVRALVGLAGAQWAAGDKDGARTALARAHEVADTGEARPWAVRQLEALEASIGRGASTTARARGALIETLTERELSILRALRGPLSTREIGAEMYLSINTVKGYTKSLYRKLGVVTRADAVRRGHELDLI